MSESAYILRFGARPNVYDKVRCITMSCKDVLTPIAGRSTHAAWYRDWRLVSPDGSTMDVADNRHPYSSFGPPGVLSTPRTNW